MASLRALLDAELAATSPISSEDDSRAESLTGETGENVGEEEEEEEEGEVEEVENEPIVVSSLPLFLRGNPHTEREAGLSTRSAAKRAQPSDRESAGEKNEAKRGTEDESSDEPLPKRNKVFSLLRDPSFAQTLRSSQRASPLVTTTPSRASKRRFTRTSSTLHISGLHPDVTEDLLFELFLQAAPLSDVLLVMDPTSGRPRGYAFVDCCDPASASFAMALLDGVPLFGMPLCVRPSEGSRLPVHPGMGRLPEISHKGRHLYRHQPLYSPYPQQQAGRGPSLSYTNAPWSSQMTPPPPPLPPPPPPPPPPPAPAPAQPLLPQPTRQPYQQLPMSRHPTHQTHQTLPLQPTPRQHAPLLGRQSTQHPHLLPPVRSLPGPPPYQYAPPPPPPSFSTSQPAMRPPPPWQRPPYY